MKISTFIKLFALAMLALTLNGVGLAIWSTNRVTELNSRAELAHNSYAAHLRLASNTNLLLRHFVNTLLRGKTSGQGLKDAAIAEIRHEIATIRSIIEQEIIVAGEQEIEELEMLQKLENTIEDIIARMAGASQNWSPEEIRKNWIELSAILSDESGTGPQALINAALAEEAEEVAEAKEEAQQELQRLRMIAGIFAVFAAAATLACLFVFRNKLSRPLSQVMGGVKRYRDGEFDHRIANRDRSEIGEIVQVLNTMAAEVHARTLRLESQNAELEDAVQRRTEDLERLLNEAKAHEGNRRRLLSDVSHELRTPLTIIQGEADIALRGADKQPAEYQDALERVREAAKHTSQLVNDLLFISRKEAGQTRLQLARTDVVELLEDVLRMGGGDIPLKTSCDSCTIDVDPLRLRQALLAFLQNAEHHAGGATAVRLDADENSVRISVEDNGPGLSDDDKEAAFERFFRGSNAAENWAQGAGLGLAVVRSIAQAHGGAAFLVDRIGGGTVGILEIPRIQTSES